MEWWVYLVRCADNSLYCGIAIDPEKREKEHNASKKGAAYTRSRRPVQLVWKQKMSSKSDALKREIEIKKLSKADKERLISEQATSIIVFKSEAIDTDIPEVKMLFDSWSIVKNMGETPILWKLTPELIKAVSLFLDCTEEETALGSFLKIPVDLCACSPGIIGESGAYPLLIA